MFAYLHAIIPIALLPSIITASLPLFSSFACITACPVYLPARAMYLLTCSPTHHASDKHAAREKPPFCQKKYHLTYMPQNLPREISHPAYLSAHVPHGISAYFACELNLLASLRSFN
jgi:hypothetical protein